MNAGLYVYNGPTRRSVPLQETATSVRDEVRSVVGQILDGFRAASLDSELIVIVIVIAIALMLAFTAACIFAS